LWEVLPEELLQAGLAGLLPLLPLTKGAVEARDATVASMIDGLRTSGKEDILALGYAFAGLVYNAETDKQWLKRRFEMFHSMLEDSWSYQEMVQKGIDQGLEKGIKQGIDQGLEKGIKQGIEQGVEQGELKASKRLLARLIATRFPTLSNLAKNHTEPIKDVDILNAVIDKLLLAETVEQAQQALSEITAAEGPN
jgi:hypothetical protein